MRVLIIGANGMLGKDLVQVFSDSSIDFLGLGKSDLDITDLEATESKLLKINPSIVILSAAYTLVDNCEDQKELANSINGNGSKNVAVACKKIGARLLYVSTDYVFDGSKDGSYIEEDPTNPINVYGQSKLLGEKYIQEVLDDYLIIRTSWLFGLGGKNFVESIFNRGQKGEDLRVVNDQIGSPTHTGDLAGAILKLAQNGTKGIINISNSGICSWQEFAAAIYSEIGLDESKVAPISTAEFGAKAPRPKNSRLSSERFEKVTGYKLRDWKEALKSYLEQRKIILKET
jgi:dTDP-4-dehydrorhamnose reductase